MKNRTYWQTNRLYLGLMLLAGSVQAGDLGQASDKLCSKIKQCTYSQLENDASITPEMREMLNNMVAAMCYEVLAHLDSAAFGQNDELEHAATECVVSMAELNCSAIESGDAHTPACARYEALAEKYEPHQ
ncbi:hypothetical protein [Salinimonas lutimaris]|uniref:hypothetical protein n=1 Tax=Salinimonas lutimaris TaxID=914153 RepID=UPI0010BFF5FF|nr:hypothetical protein [Salinimonas lutimaris]